MLDRKQFCLSFGKEADMPRPMSQAQRRAAFLDAAAQLFD
jgi:hypothetical protein